MKKSFRQSLVGILAFLTFAGLGFAQEKVAKPYFEIYGVDGAITEDNPAVSIPDITDNDISIKCTTEGVTIWYTLDGSDPSLAADGTPEGTTTQLDPPTKSFYVSDYYENPGDHLTIKAMATKEGMTQSDIISASFYKQGEAPTTPEEKPASPTFNPASGEITAGETITIASTTTDAEIFYALNDGDFSKYENPVALNEVGNVTLKAYAKKGEAQSETATTTYTVTAPAPQPTVTFNPASGIAVKSGTQITITAENTGDYSTIYYQTGSSIESIPDFRYNDANTSNYYKPISISKEKPAIKVAIIVSEDENYNHSYKYFSAVYTIDENAGDTEKPKADNPTFSIASGEVDAGTRIKVSPINETYIAVGDTKPTSGYILNDNVGEDVVPILTINEAKTIWAFTSKDGYSNSDTISATYTVKAPAPQPSVTFNPASGSTVKEGDKITITAENTGDYETIYYQTGTSIESIPNFPLGDCKTYTQPIAITAAEPAIKAMLIVGENGDDYLYKYFNATYTVTAPAPTKPEAPVFTPKGGTVLPNTPVVIAKGTADSIFWKAGESATAVFTKSLEDVSVTITENTVLCAFAMKDGLSSDTAKVSYKVPSGPTDPNKATVRLVVNGKNIPYGDNRNQYQILLDAKHTITDEFKTDLKKYPVGLPANLLPRLYGEKTSTVPTGITAENATTSGVSPDDEDAVLVEPGTYDIFLLQSQYYVEKDILRGIYKSYNDTDGYEYFALDDISLEAGKSYVFNVTFATDGAYGELLVSVDLQLSHILGENKPSCELDSIALSLAIKNVGLTTVSQYIAYCTNGNDTIKETVNKAVDAGKSTTYAFTEKLELKNGQNTVLKAGIIVENETNTVDNTAEYVAFKSEVGTLPLDINPAKMLSAKAGDWSIDGKNNALVAARHASSPVFSSCFHADEAGKYRLSYGYICGRYVEKPDGQILVNNVDVYEVRVGKTSLAYESWQVVAADSTITGSSNYNEFTSKDIVFDLQESGDYAFCIVPRRVNDKDNLKFRGMTVEMMQASAARINSFTVNSPRIVPQDWGTASYQASINVENRGFEKIENATLSVLVNGKEACQRTVSIDLNAKQDLSVDIPVSGFKKDDLIRITANISLNDQSIAQGTATPAEITVSENTAAFDYLTDFSYFKTMDGYTDGLVGIIFPVVKKDTLTGISCAWGAITENTDISIAIHKVSVSGNEVSMGDKLHEAVVRRGVSSGLTTYKTPAFLLEPGNYFISVEQIGRLGFALAMDEHPSGGFFVYDEKAESTWRYITTGGYPVIRAVFGSDGVLTSKDAAITAISKPIAGGIFANNEPIVVSVRNNSAETAQIPVHVRVDNTLLESKSVSVEAYTTQEVSFTADLAATNQNRNITITAFTAMEGDEDHSNDTLRKNVLSMVPADPYRMDFESCLDFATEGLNPAWTSVSLDNSPVMPLRHVLEDYTFQYIEFPGCETDLGFITFNPLYTEPSMVLFDHYNECRSHSGQRFGVSLAITDENSPKNDWLISPKLKMPSKNTQLSMWVKSFDRVYKESYEIWVSEGSDDPTSEDFICLYPGEDEELIAPTEWTQVVFDLGLYNGKDIHVAIRCNSDDAPMFMVDDIVIGENADNEDAQSSDFRLSVYPNPAKEMVNIISPDVAIHTIAVFNLSGNLVHSANGLNTDSYRFNTGRLTSGIYFVRVTSERGTAIQKFVVR